MIRQTVHYTGRVQGVGFRFTASHIARGYSVSGCVRNLADGRVELIAEGDRAEVARFLAELTERMAGNIKHVDQQEGAGRGEFVGFSVVK